MIDLYTWTTPNGRKVSILLEELGVPYAVHAIDIAKDEQFAPEFLKISPNNKIPAIVDQDTGVSLMESGAILLYLAQKDGRFVATGDGYWRMMEWLMWQMGGFGPMLGQTHHFLKFNKGVSEYAEARYGKEAARLYSVLDTHLAGHDYMAGEYGIADMAIFPWAARFEWQDVNLNDFPKVRDWYLRIADRPAVQKGYQVPKFVTEIPMP
ncbi:MAG: glutathione S-transferase family protein [Pelagibaca sp.]